MRPGSLKRIRIVGIGDSTTAGTPGFLSPLEAPPRGAGDERSQYAHWMAVTHGGWEVLNRGVNGERSDQILARFGRDAVLEDPRLVVILCGVNDVYQGFQPKFTQGNLARMYSLALEAKVTPVACSILPYNTSGQRETKTIRELNDWIARVSKKLSIPFSDTNRAVASPDRPDRLAGSPDGLHPDIEGYRRMGLAISMSIEGYLLAEAGR